MTEDFSLLRYLRIVRRQAWLIVLCLVAALASAAIYLSAQKSVYRASMKIAVGQGGGIFRPADSGAVDPLTQTMSSLLKSDVVATAVIRNLGLRLQPRQLLHHLAVSTRPQTAVLNVHFDSSNKVEAVEILRETGNVFTTLVARLGRQIPSRSAGGTAPVTATTWDPAHLEPGRVSPERSKTLLIAGVLATLLGIALAFARESLRPRIDSRQQAEEWFGAPVLVTLPKRPAKPRSIDFSSRSHRRAKLVHQLALLTAQLEARQGIGGLIVVASVEDDAARNMVVAYLGAAFAAAGQDAICVETGEHSAAVGAYLGVGANSRGRTYGLVDVVEGRVELDRALRVVGPGSRRGGAANKGATSKTDSSSGRGQPLRPPLRLLQAGRMRSSKARTLSSETLISVTKTLSSVTSYLIIDSPPVLRSAQAVALSTVSDAILVVAELGCTTKADAEAFQRIFRTVERSEIGIVLCQSPSVWSRLKALRPARTRKPAKVGASTRSKAAVHRERSSGKGARGTSSPSEAASRAGQASDRT